MAVERKWIWRCSVWFGPQPAQFASIATCRTHVTRCHSASIHIVALKHHGNTEEINLALACYNCNTYKRSNIAGIDPMTGEMTLLFNPRTSKWHDHFEWKGVELTGRTAIGPTTCDVLAVNHPDHVEHRRLLMVEGRFTG